MNLNKIDERCPHLNCLVYHPNGVCNCEMKRYCPQCQNSSGMTIQDINNGFSIRSRIYKQEEVDKIEQLAFEKGKREADIDKIIEISESEFTKAIKNKILEEVEKKIGEIDVELDEVGLMNRILQTIEEMKK